MIKTIIGTAIILLFWAGGAGAISHLVSWLFARIFKFDDCAEQAVAKVLSILVFIVGAICLIYYYFF